MRVRIYVTYNCHFLCIYLQRTERSGRGDDSSPARLTMAQAALLNLRGQQMQGRLRVSQHPTNLSDQRRLLSAQSPVSVNDFPSLHHHQHGRLPPHPIMSQDPENNLLTISHSAPARLHGCNELAPGGLPTALGSDIDLSALSRTAGTNGFTPLEQQLILQARLQAEIDARQRAFYGSQSNITSGGPIQTLSLFSDQSEELSRSLNNLSLRSAHIAKEFVPRGLASRLHQPPRSPNCPRICCLLKLPTTTTPQSHTILNNLNPYRLLLSNNNTATPVQSTLGFLVSHLRIVA